MDLTKTPVVLPTMLSPLGKACARIDLTAVHEILLKTGYKDEEGAENEVSSSVVTFYSDVNGACKSLNLMQKDHGGIIYNKKNTNYPL